MVFERQTAVRAAAAAAGQSATAVKVVVPFSVTAARVQHNVRVIML